MNRLQFLKTEAMVALASFFAPITALWPKRPKKQLPTPLCLEWEELPDPGRYAYERTEQRALHKDYVLYVWLESYPPNWDVEPTWYFTCHDRFAYTRGGPFFPTVKGQALSERNAKFFAEHFVKTILEEKLSQKEWGYVFPELNAR